MAEYELVDKITAARRQLKTAIQMFFEQKDPIAIHSLCWASYQILIDLCAHAGIEREIEDSQILKDMGKLNEVVAAMRKPHTFFKHSDRNPNSTVKFFPDATHLTLLMAYQYFYKLTQETLIEGQTLQMWFFLKYPDRVPIEWKQNLHKLSQSVSSNDFDVFLDLIKKDKN